MAADPQAPVRIGVSGALGRMGVNVATAVRARPELELAARFDRPGAEGEGLVAAAEALKSCDVIIDFSTPQASVALARAAAEHGGPALVIGSTGLDPAQEAAIAQAAERIAVVRSGNFSLGVNLLLGLVRQAARALPASDYDIEIVEAHHRRKVDAPSGTALMLGEAAASGRGKKLSAVEVRARDGLTGPREPGAIGFAVLRGGGVVGEHSVLFAAEDEIITLAHSARDRALFARGAVEAALWAAGKTPGLYGMAEVLGMAP
jgi:4-hydroxy-tetrahydrodipicolinate reductase